MAPLTYQIGCVRMHLISDGVFWMDGGGVFGVCRGCCGRRSSNRMRSIASRWSSRLLIESGEGLILVDTGYGAKLPPKWLQQLNLTSELGCWITWPAAGFTAADVRMVINTHLHADHCGGNTVLGPDGQLQPTFPNATYLMQRLELADAFFPNERTRGDIFRGELPAVGRSVCGAATARGAAQICSAETPR